MSSNHELFQRAIKRMPGGVNSPVRAFKSVGGEPFFTQRAEGAYLWDVEGKRYIDYVGSWGPMVAGHNHPHVREAVERAIRDGLSFGTPCPAEVDDGGDDLQARSIDGNGAHGEFRHRSDDGGDSRGARLYRAATPS